MASYLMWPKATCTYPAQDRARSWELGSLDSVLWPGQGRQGPLEPYSGLRQGT